MLSVRRSRREGTTDKRLDYRHHCRQGIYRTAQGSPAPDRTDPSPGNRATLAACAGESKSDPTLAARLSDLTVPTLVLWGANDQIVDADYGRAYAQVIPGARVELLTETGHSPQLETPAQVLKALNDKVSHRPRRRGLIDARQAAGGRLCAPRPNRNAA